MLLSHPRIGYVVAYGAAALVATVRGNDAWTRAYEQKALEGMDEIMEQSSARNKARSAGPAGKPVIHAFIKEKTHGSFRRDH